MLTPGDLSRLLASGQPIKHYIGFEISGKMHLGTGLICMGKVKDFLDAGVECTIFLADWHTWINDKLGGDREVIKGVAAEYFKEGFKASMQAAGVVIRASCNSCSVRISMRGMTTTGQRSLT